MTNYFDEIQLLVYLDLVESKFLFVPQILVHRDGHAIPLHKRLYNLNNLKKLRVDESIGGRLVSRSGDTQYVLIYRRKTGKYDVNNSRNGLWLWKSKRHSDLIKDWVGVDFS